LLFGGWRVGVKCYLWCGVIWWLVLLGIVGWCYVCRVVYLRVVLFSYARLVFYATGMYIIGCIIIVCVYTNATLPLLNIAYLHTQLHIPP